MVIDPKGQTTRFGYYDANFFPGLSDDTYPSTGQPVPSEFMGRVRGYSDRMGQTTWVEPYNATNPPPATEMPAGSSDFARVLDVDGQQTVMTTYGIDAYGRTMQVTDPNAHATKLGWDADHNVVRLEEQNGAVSRWVYDQATGFPRRMWDAEAVATGGAARTMSYTTAPTTGATVLASIVSPMGRTTTFGHDDRAA